MIQLHDVTKRYGPVVALHGVSLTMARGEYVALMGSSGAGKTTLMNILGCLDRPTTGMYHLDGQLIHELGDAELSRLRGERIGFVFQLFHLLPRLSLLDNVLLPTLYANTNSREDRARAIELLTAVGLGHRLRHRPTEVSGGEQQRAAIARALIRQPMLLLADEPTGNLDSVAGQEILNVFENLNNEGLTILIVTHDQQVGERCKRKITMRDGTVIGDVRSHE